MIDACAHCGSEALNLRQKHAVNGTRLVAYQCTDCGRGASSWLKQSTIPNVDGLPPWDEALEQQKYREFQAQAQEQRRIEFESKSEEWWLRYTEYLQSPAWRSRRAAVLQRARGICEGCGINPAVQVHHLTYEHVTEEFLWELVAVCLPCHDRVDHKTPS